jgi:hypothetical protein
MPAPHVIRLREPWEAEPIDAGGVRYRRRFGWTAELGPEDRVFLAMDADPDEVQVQVNGVSLPLAGPRDGPARFEVTSLLQPCNEAVIETAGGGVDKVRLEIHAG